jgi:hypothetical protein
MDLTINISNEVIHKAKDLVRFVAKTTPRFILKRKFLTLMIWGLPAIIYGLYLGHKY